MGDVARALARFRKFCRFEPETGCVVWTGGTTKGRGHHVPYPAFWYGGRRWFGHRWAAKFIHDVDIEGLHVDHCCPNIPKPNTLCVQHVQGISARENRELQETRKRFIYLQVGLLCYDDLYRYPLGPPAGDMPFYECPDWLKGPIE